MFFSIKKEMTEIERFICPTCNRECKDKRGLSIHMTRCQDIQASICLYCNHDFKSHYNLERHKVTCMEFKLFKQRKEYEDIIDDLNKKYQHQFDQLKHQYQLDSSRITQQYETSSRVTQIQLDQYHKECHTLTKENNDLKEQIRKLTSQAQEDKEKHDKERRGLVRELDESKRLQTRLIDKMIDNPQGMNVSTNNINGNVNNNHIQNIQVYNFDPAKFRGLFPLSRLITSEDQIVTHLLEKGLKNYYRVTDRSRGTILWVDHQGQEIRDAGATALTNCLYDTLKEDFEAQKEYSSKKLDQPNLNLDQITKYSNSMKISDRVIRKDSKSIAEVGKQLSKRGLNKNDPSLVKTLVSNTLLKFTNSLGSRLADDVLQWLWMDLSDFGTYLYETLQDLILFRSGMHIKKPYFIVHNDAKNDCQLFYHDLPNLLYQSLKDSMFGASQEIIFRLIEQIGKLSSANEQSIVLQWILEPEEQDSKNVLREILLAQ